MTDQQTIAVQATWATFHSKVTCDQRVELKGAPDLIVEGVAYQPYSLLVELVRYGSAAWHASVLLYTLKRQHGGGLSLRCTTIRGDVLGELPQWLDAIVARVKAKATEAHPFPAREQDTTNTN